MAFNLYFTNEQAGGDLEFVASALRVIRYPLAYPTSEEQLYVTETITVYFDSGLQAAITADGILRKLNRYFMRARRRQKQQSGYKTWIKFNPGYGDLHRSEVIDGRIVHPEEVLNPAYLLSDKGEVAIIITRRAFWEKDEEYEIPLLNSSIGAAATGGVDIENHDDADAGDDNWVTWSAAAIVGDLPAPLRIEFENTHGSVRPRRVLMGLTHETDDATDFTTNWSLEGEDNGTNPGTVTASATSSDGNYMLEQWTGATETLVASWTFPNTEISRGNPFRVLMRIIPEASPYTNLYARLVMVGAYGDGELWRSKLIKVAYEASAATELCDLGTVPAIPANYPEGQAADSVKFYLYFLRNTSGTHTVRIDHLTFMPIDGGFRTIDSSATVNTLDNSQFLIDDAINERTYRRTSLGAALSQWTTTGDYFEALPGQGARLTFMWSGNTTAEANLTATVRVYYRARRLSI
jgi:hypothetical protein